jgi:hypothetical protein
LHCIVQNSIGEENNKPYENEQEDSEEVMMEAHLCMIARVALPKPHVNSRR